MDHQRLKNRLRSHALFEGLSDPDLDRLAELAEETTLPAEAELTREGEVDKSLFILLSGSASVNKLSPEGKETHCINTLPSGSVIGEIGLLDNAPKSATVRTLEDSSALKLDGGALQNRREYAKIRDKLFANLARDLSRRLRETNDVTVAALKRELQESKAREGFGVMFVRILALLCLYTVCLGVLLELGVNFKGNLARGSTIPSLCLVTLFCCVSFGWVKWLRRTGHAMAEFGFTTRDWRPALKEALLWTIVGCALFLLIKWLLITTVFPGRSLFKQWDPHTVPVLIGFLIAYALSCPVQEAIARGFLQTPLQQLLSGSPQRRLWTAIVLSNLLFAVFHIHVSVGFAVASLLPGLFWGWLYSRHPTLIGVSVSHVLFGVWVYVVGTDQLLGG